MSAAGSGKHFGALSTCYEQVVNNWWFANVLIIMERLLVTINLVKIV